MLFVLSVVFSCVVLSSGMFCFAFEVAHKRKNDVFVLRSPVLSHGRGYELIHKEQESCVVEVDVLSCAFVDVPGSSNVETQYILCFIGVIHVQGGEQTNRGSESLQE